MAKKFQKKDLEKYLKAQKRKPTKKSVLAQVRDGDIISPYSNKKPKGRSRKIILESKRGTKQENPAVCAECKMLSTVWSYSKSNYGRVNLCRPCKSLVFDRSFGKIDALDLANTGGKFEGNRHKH